MHWAYEAAGADMILIHSKKKDPSEIGSVARAWDGNVPLTIVPNAYPELDACRIEALGNIRIVIYGTTACAQHCSDANGFPAHHCRWRRAERS